MRKRVLTCLTVILLLSMLTGCWNRKELNTLSVVQAVGIDRLEDGQFSVSVQILIPSAGSMREKHAGCSGFWGR